MKTEGMDSLFRFGLTNFYVHSNVLVIRLNVALVSENAASLLSSCNQKVRNREGSHLLFKEDKEYQVIIKLMVGICEFNSHIGGHVEVNIHKEVTI